MNFSVLVTLSIITALAALISVIAFVSLRSSPKPEAEPRRPVTDPALPEIRDQAISRLLSLPHFRRILDGTIFDYYRGARLETCDCEQLPYPHLILDYGGKQSVVFETSGALEQYVAVQEAVAASLMTGMNSGPSSGAESR